MSRATNSEGGVDRRDFNVPVETAPAVRASHHAKTSQATSACKARRGAPGLDPEHPLMGPHPTD